MNIHQHGPPPVISVMLAVTDAPAAIAWYERALGATVGDRSPLNRFA